MSSKEQFRDALKRENRLISNMRLEIQMRDSHVKFLEEENLRLKLKIIELQRQKKWWQFWK